MNFGIHKTGYEAVCALVAVDWWDVEIEAKEPHSKDVFSPSAYQKNRVQLETHRQKAAEYVARIENMEFLCASSCRIASVNNAVASTWCGTLPRNFQASTLHRQDQQKTVVLEEISYHIPLRNRESASLGRRRKAEDRIRSAPPPAGPWFSKP